MDPFSHRLANALVGNAPDLAALEITLEGPELSFDDDRLIAVAGAEFSVTVDQEIVAHTRAFRIRGGARVRFGSRLRGARAYLAISGGIDVPRVFASRSTHLPSRMGGLGGRPLIAGDRLLLGRPSEFRRRERPTAGAPVATDEDVVRVLPGPQRYRFQEDATDVLQSAPYLVTAESNRMGFRLRGSPLRHLRGADIISDATPMGSIQVPASGQPILLMADRQTTGGYPKLATVIAADFGVVAQRAPGESIRFKVCTRAEAMAALIARERAVMAVESGS
jgi:antagonist of KipI